MKNKTPRVLIVVQGGSVEDVISDQPVEIIIKDIDQIKECGEEFDPESFVNADLVDDEAEFNGKLAEDTNIPICPHCSSLSQPVPNDDDPDHRHKRLNPWKCPDCYGVGDGEDFNLIEVESPEG